jgi:PAS domain S-box-containing protein
MPGTNAEGPTSVGEARPTTATSERWQDFYKSLISDVTTWAATKALIQALPETLPDALMIVDAAGAIVLVNSQLELMFGYHRSELIGQSPEFLLPPELREEHAGLRREYADAPRARGMAIATGMIFRARRKNDTELLVHVMLNPVATPDGVGTIAVIRRAHSTGLAIGPSDG